MRTVLVIFYSLSGTSSRVASLLAAADQWPVGEVRESRLRSGWRGTWQCGVDSLLRRRPRVLYLGPDPRRFELVVFVGPIWMRRLCGPLRSFAAACAPHLNAYALVSTLASGRGGAAGEELRRLVGRPPVLYADILSRSVQDGSAAGDIAVIAATLAVNAPRQARAQPGVLSPNAT